MLFLRAAVHNVSGAGDCNCRRSRRFRLKDDDDFESYDFSNTKP